MENNNYMILLLLILLVTVAFMAFIIIIIVVVKIAFHTFYIWRTDKYCLGIRDSQFDTVSKHYSA